MAIRAKYVGDGNSYFNGIPMRDLTQEEYDTLSNDQRADLRANDAYEVLTDKEYADVISAAKRPSPPPTPVAASAAGKDDGSQSDA